MKNLELLKKQLSKDLDEIDHENYDEFFRCIAYKDDAIVVPLTREETYFLRLEYGLIEKENDMFDSEKTNIHKIIRQAKITLKKYFRSNTIFETKESILKYYLNDLDYLRKMANSKLGAYLWEQSGNYYGCENLGDFLGVSYYNASDVSKIGLLISNGVSLEIMSIGILDLKEDVLFQLRDKGIYTLGQLMCKSIKELLEIGIDIATIKYLKSKLNEEYGLMFIDDFICNWVDNITKSHNQMFLDSWSEAELSAIKEKGIFDINDYMLPEISEDDKKILSQNCWLKYFSINQILKWKILMNI